MRNSVVQMTLWDICNGVSESIEEQKPELIRLLEEHFDFNNLIPGDFNRAFYCRMGRSHVYHLESFIRALVLQKLLGISSDALLITILHCCRELREFCGFSKVPDASQFSRFRRNFCGQLTKMFEHLVELTEPMNIRNSKTQDANFDESGRPICPVDRTPFLYLGKSKGKNRSLRFKWVCPKSVQKGTTQVCTCENPCTASAYGKCVYTYPDKNFRLYPGIPRNTEHWDNLYRHRVTVERTINLFKDTFVLDARKSVRSCSAKADTYLAGIVQLIGVLLANAMHKPECIKSVRKLIAS